MRFAWWRCGLDGNNGQMRGRSSLLNKSFRVAGMVALAGLAACATPRYQMVQRQELPADAAGRACVAQCAQNMSACQGGCDAAYQACLKTLDPRVNALFADALKQYETELDRYRWDLERYQFDLWAGWHQGPWWVAPGWSYPWYGPGFYSPPPSRPDRDRIAEELGKENCDAGCTCQPAYDSCFITCGGRYVPETRCVENCPPSQR